MKADYATPSDFNAWLDLAREVEPLFGPMADEPSFQDALKQAISEKTAFCVRMDETLKGAVVISEEMNEIIWLAVSADARGKGGGKSLLECALGRLDTGKPIMVQTFDDSVPEGIPARKLYASFGFTDLEKGETNPAGVPTVIMQRPC